MSELSSNWTVGFICVIIIYVIYAYTLLHIWPSVNQIPNGRLLVEEARVNELRCSVCNATHECTRDTCDFIKHACRCIHGGMDTSCFSMSVVYVGLHII